MDGKGHKRVKAKQDDYQPPEEKVFKIDTNGKVDVLMGETLDIDLDCKEGFTLFIPYPGLFEAVDGSDQVFEASEHPVTDAPEPIKEKLWRVRLRRKNQVNPYENKQFAYCIYSPELDNFAMAASPPRMNLKP